MNEMKSFVYINSAPTECDSFEDASRDELRALIALMEAKRPLTADEVADRAKISSPRAASALMLWAESGVIRESSVEPVITEEFDTPTRKGEISERAATTVAGTIRRESLAAMLSECAAVLGRAALNTEEIKEITALYDQYSLSEEYILTLATYLTRGGERRVAVRTLINAAIKYSTEMDITTAEELDEYIKKKESESAVSKEFRRIFGIYDRPLSKTEAECFDRWSREYGYFVDVVGEAYDIAVMGGYKKLVAKANELLKRWHETGCKTVRECRERFEQDQAEAKSAREAERKDKRATAKPRDTYSDYDPDEALRLALQRSFGTEEDDK